MQRKVNILDVSKATDISPEVLLPNGKLKLLMSSEWGRYDYTDKRLFCHNHARYGLVTTELRDYLRTIIRGRAALEIGAGHGDLGYHLGIHSTDSYLQDNAEVALTYLLMGQPTIQYPADVEKLEAIKAIEKYKPRVVVASWVTTLGDPTKEKYGCNVWGIDEEKILSFDFVETFILVGNLDTHGDKPIMKREHMVFESPFLVSRAKNSDNNRVFVWSK